MSLIVFHGSLDVGLHGLGGIGSSRHAVDRADGRGFLAGILGQHA